MGSSLSASALLLIVIFPQSSCSFWPFAHMTVVDQLEKKNQASKTFDTTFALNLLAFSLPYSTITILSLCSVGPSVANTGTLLSLGIPLVIVPILFKMVMKKRMVTLPTTDRPQLVSFSEK